MDKRKVRNEIKRRIAQLSDSDKQTASSRVCEKIASMSSWQEADQVLLYDALPDEISVDTLIALAKSQGKKVLCPEAKADAAPLTDLEEVGLVIVPGRAFTKDGARLGRGKAYYDNMLARLKCPKIGVAFECQKLEKLPTDVWDISMDEVVFG